MITVDMYEIGEQVLIKASVIDISVEQGKLKYKLRVEHTNDELEHTFSENQIMPVVKTMEDHRDECLNEADKLYEEDKNTLIKCGLDPDKIAEDS